MKTATLHNAKIVVASFVAFIMTLALLPLLQVIAPANVGVTRASAVSIDGGWGGGGSVFGSNSSCSGSACGALASSGGGGGAGDPNRSYQYLTCDGVENCTKNFATSVTNTNFTQCTGGGLYYNNQFVGRNPSQGASFANSYTATDTGARAMANYLSGKDGSVKTLNSRTIRGVYTNPNDGATRDTTWRYVQCNVVWDGRVGWVGGSHSCGPDYSRPFPYPVAISVVSYDQDNSSYTHERTGEVRQNNNIRMESVSCLYINPSTPPRKILYNQVNCYWNVTYSSAGSTNRAAIQWGGTPTKQPPIVRVADTSKQPYVVEVNRVPELRDCTTFIPYSAALNLEGELYAYYRLQANGLTQGFQQYVWDTAWTGGRAITAEWRASAVTTLRDARYSVYTCSMNGGSPVTYPSFGSLPTNVNFRESACPQVNWSCQIPDAPQINGTAQATTVMRDGTLVPLRLPGLNLSGSGIRDVTTKAAGAVDGSNLSYILRVNNGSSPFLGTDPNAAKQYFNLLNQNGTTLEKFDVWMKNPNANVNKNMKYYWSSDNGKTWSLTYSARVDQAEFYVPVVAASDRGVYYEWRVDRNLDCGSRSSNPVNVIRSVNSQG